MEKIFDNNCPLKHAHFRLDERKVLINLYDTVNDELADKILTESLGSFSLQKEMSFYIAEKCLNVLNNKSDSTISVDLRRFQDCLLKEAEITIKVIEFDESRGEIYSLDTDKVYINLYINAYTLTALKREELIHHIATIISHELMHGNIYLQRYKNNQVINDSPDYYSTVVQIIRDYGTDNIVGNFAHALYNTYYQERQAFVSQTNLYVKSQIKNKNNLSTHEFYRLIKSTMSYSIYANNLDTVNKLENSEFLRGKVLNVFSKYGLFFHMKDFMQLLKWIKHVSENTLQKIIKNAVLALDL